MIGLGIGLQPIVGFNYGARNYKRVKETFKTTLKTAVGIGLVFSILLQCFPYIFIRMFGTGSKLYFDFASLSFRIIFTGQIFIAVCIITSNFFRAIGKPWMAVLSASARFTVFFIPSIYFLPKIFGLIGVLLVTPITESISAIFALWLISIEMKKLNRLIKNEEKRNKN